MSSTVELYIERFFGFYDVSLGQNAEEFSIQKFDFKINGLQTKIKSVAPPQALFTHTAMPLPSRTQGLKPDSV
jgi:hypothetical protein